MRRAPLIAYLAGGGCAPDFHVGSIAMGGATVTGMITLVDGGSTGPTTATARFYRDAGHLYLIDEVTAEIGAHLSGVGDAEPFLLHSIPVQLWIDAKVLGKVCATLDVGRSDVHPAEDVGCLSYGVRDRI